MDADAGSTGDIERTKSGLYVFPTPTLQTSSRKPRHLESRLLTKRAKRVTNRSFFIPLASPKLAADDPASVASALPITSPNPIFGLAAGSAPPAELSAVPKNTTVKDLKQAEKKRRALLASRSSAIAARREARRQEALTRVETREESLRSHLADSLEHAHRNRAAVLDSVVKAASDHLAKAKSVRTHVEEEKRAAMERQAKEIERKLTESEARRNRHHLERILHTPGSQRRRQAKAAVDADADADADTDADAKDQAHRAKAAASEDEHEHEHEHDDDDDDESNRAAMNSNPANFPPIGAFLARPLAAHDAVRAAVENRNTTTEMDVHLLSVTDPAQLRRAGLNLTKLEERELKHLRRRLKNKLAAAESRRRKKTYVAGLEKRIQDVAAENAQLQQRLAAMESELRALRAENQTLKEAQSAPAPAPAPAAAAAHGPNKRQRRDSDAEAHPAAGSLVAHFSGHAQSPAAALSRTVKARSSYLMIFALTFGLLHSWITADSASSGARSLLADADAGIGAAGEAPAAGAAAAAEPRSTVLRTALLNIARVGKAADKTAPAAERSGFVARRILQHDGESAMDAGDFAGVLPAYASLDTSPLDLDGNVTYLYDFSDDGLGGCDHGGDDVPAAVADDADDVFGF